LAEPDRNADEYAIAHESLRTLRFRDRAPGTPAALGKAGVKFAFATENTVNATDILRNVNKSIAAGLSPDAALKAMTLDAAEILGVGAQVGSIQAGKIANLVVTSGDIFKEGTAVKWVFVDGERYEVRPKPPEPSPGGGEDAAARIRCRTARASRARGAPMKGRSESRSAGTPACAPFTSVSMPRKRARVAPMPLLCWHF